MCTICWSGQALCYRGNQPTSGNEPNTVTTSPGIVTKSHVTQNSSSGDQASGLMITRALSWSPSSAHWWQFFWTTRIDPTHTCTSTWLYIFILNVMFKQRMWRLNEHVSSATLAHWAPYLKSNCMYGTFQYRCSTLPCTWRHQLRQHLLWRTASIDCEFLHHTSQNKRSMTTSYPTFLALQHETGG